jgi:hypothetical protein
VEFDLKNPLVTLILGALLALIAAWINDQRKEKHRRAAERDRARIAWLDAQASILPRLKGLSREMTRGVDTPERSSLLAKQLAELRTDLRSLVSALHGVLVHERRSSKREKFEEHSRYYSSMIEALEAMLRHHDTHMEYRHALERGEL